MKLRLTRKVLGCVFGVLTACELPPEGEAPPPAEALTAGQKLREGKLLKTPNALPGRYIVVLEDKAAPQAQVDRLAAELGRAHGASVKRVFRHALKGFSVSMPEAAARALAADPRVRYVEEDAEVRLDGTQTNATWGLDRIDQRDLPRDGLYTYGTTGSGVNAYIIDTGIRLTHADFAGRAFSGFDAIGDGNGTNDCHGHGTHVAGTVGGTVWGVAKNVNLHAVRVLSCSGSGTFEGVIAGVDWVTANHVKPAVANMSLGGSASQAVDDAVTASIASGVVYAIAAGNDSGDACSKSPARTPNALTVGSTTTTDARSSFSNYGTCVDLFAPGSDITSAWISSDTATNTISGTSMAAPHVAGAAALYLEDHPTATPQTVMQELKERATPGKVTSPGSGSPNLLLYSGCTGTGDTTPPQVTLTAPAAGVTLSGPVPLTATATDNAGVKRVEFFLDGSLIGSDTTAPFEVTWDSTSVSNGPGVLSAKAYDTGCNSAPSAGVSVVIANPGNATFDAALGAPACASVGSQCDTVGLLAGRGPAGPELHAPNTLGGTCADGTAGSYRSSPSLERLKVVRPDGTLFAGGKQVRLEASVWASSSFSSERLDLYYAPDALNPSWTLITTLTPGGSGSQVLAADFFLPVGALQAVRGVYRSGGTPDACAPGSLDDHDDLVFAVGNGADTEPPTSVITAPAQGTTVIETLQVSASASDNYGVTQVEFFAGDTLLGTDTSAPFGVPWNTRSVANGTYTLTARAWDATGLSTASAPVTVLVDNDYLAPSVALTSPADGATLQGVVTLETSATDDRGVTRVDFFSGTTLLGSDTTAPYSLSWDTRLLPNGTYTLTARASDAAGNMATSNPATVSISNALTVIHDPVLKAPRCTNVSSTCDSLSLLMGRAGLGPEQNAPNTLHNSCSDGPSGVFHISESLDRIRVMRVDGTDLAVGKRVRIEVDVWAASTNLNALDLFVAADATNPVWQHLATLQPSATGAQTLTAEYILPAGSLQAVRGNFRYGGYASYCAFGYYDDHDDLVFAVGQEADEVAPTVTLTAPASGAVVSGIATVSAAAEDHFAVTRVEFFHGSTRIGSDTSPPFSVSWNTTAVPQGPVVLSARAFDAAGNVGTSAPVTVTVGPDTEAPTVVIYSPTHGATVQGNVYIQASGSDVYGVQRLELYLDGLLHTTSTTGSISSSWNTRTMPNGVHELTAIAYDAAGNMGIATPVRVTVDNDFTAPSVAFTSPVEGAEVYETISLTATASDNRGVTRVEFYAGVTRLAIDTTAPYSASWNARSVPNGPFTLSVVAYDAVGYEGTHDITVLVANDNTPPAVSLTAPTAGTRLQGTVSLQATASDSRGVSRVEFFAGTTLLGSDTTAPYALAWDTTSVTDGDYSLSAKAYDAVGNVGTSSAVQVTVRQPSNALYDAALRVPACRELASKCDTTTLVRGRANLGPEPNTPNTLQGTCQDGTLGIRKSIDAIRVIREDGTPFAAGKKVRVEMDLYVSNSSTDELFLFSAPDANNPVWTLIGTLFPPGEYAKTAVTEYTLPSGSLQALRVVFGHYSQGPSPCLASGSSSSMDDRDDIVFAVGQEVDTESPTVALTAPAPGALLRGSVAMSAVAGDNFGVQRVEFFAGSTLLATDTHFPYSFWWNTAALANGTHVLTAKAYDSAGHVTTSQGVTVQVDNAAPSVAFIAPTPPNEASVQGVVPLQVSASDNHQLVRVEFRDNGALLGMDTTAPYSVNWDTAALEEGSHNLSVIAYDLAGNAAGTNVFLFVDRTAPTVAITSPAQGASVFLSTTISVNASDNRAVTRVEFYDGAKLIGTDTTSPYSLGWNTLSVPKGSHTLTAKAYDAVGHATTSAGVTVQVK